MLRTYAGMQRYILHVYLARTDASMSVHSIKIGSMLLRGGGSKRSAHVGTTSISHDVTHTHKPGGLSMPYPCFGHLKSHYFKEPVGSSAPAKGCVAGSAQLQQV